MSKSNTTAKEVCCDRCGEPVGNVWFSTSKYEVICLSCFGKGEGKVAS